jgi:hypothetical protein
MQKPLREIRLSLIASLVLALECLNPQMSRSAVVDSTNAGQLQACNLLSNADVEKVTGQKMYSEPTPMALKGGAGALCGFDNAQVIVFSGSDSEVLWEEFLKAFGYNDVQKYPLSDLGDPAYAVYFEPKNEYQDGGTFVVVPSAKRTVAVSVSAKKGQPAESVQPQAVELTRLVLAKLKG